MTDSPTFHDEPSPHSQTASPAWTPEETASRLEATLQGVRMPLAMLDFQSGTVRCNRACLELFGIAPEALAREGVRAIEVATARLVKSSPVAVPRFSEIPPGVERRDIHHFIDGRIFERTVTPCDVGDRTVGHVVTYRDVTAAARADAALEKSRELLEQAQQVAHVGSWVADLVGGRVEWSQETMRIFDLTREQVPHSAEGFYRLVHADDHAAVRDALRRIESGGTYDIEHRILRPSGEVRWVHGRAEVERDEDGRPRRLIGTLQDITERRRLEEQLRQAQKLEAIGRLAGGVAHDLNNALTSIVGYTELAMGALAPDHPASADVLEIRRAAERAESVTRQLLAFSRKQPLKPRVFSLPDVVTGISRMLTRFLGGRVELEVVIAPAVAPVSGDPGQIEQAIVNLCVNARDAMPEGGRLQLAVSMARVDAEIQSQHDVIPAGDYVELRIRDTGTGMSTETMTHIFEPFFTTKEPGKGTGLGLATVYGTIKQTGAFIAVESTVGEGTTFTFRFPPAASTPAAPEPAVSETKAVSVNEPTVLIVEDEQPVRNLVLLSLANRGYRLLSAGSGAQALELLAKEQQPIDVLLTDANMPGMNGVELVRLLLAERPSLRVIIMSGFTEDLPRLGELEEKVGLLPKPFTPKDVRERVDRLLGRL